jgi:H/ACA ribonucleoprotein complex subunit 3
MNKILRCDACNTYTMQKTCPQCKAATRQAKPAKYSPEDRWGSYRRRAKEEAAQSTLSTSEQ